MRLGRGTPAIALGIASAFGVLAACSDDASRPPFDDDGGPPASLPDAGGNDALVDANVPDTRGPFDPSDEAVACDAGTCVLQIVAGDSHFCARMQDRSVRCWGDDEKGQRGLGPEGSADAGPAKPQVLALEGVSQVSAAGRTTCARREDGTVSCWGANAHGELGSGLDPARDEDGHPLASNVALEAGVARVDVGHGSVCATTSEGAVYCWGADDSMQLARLDGGGAAASPPERAELDVLAKRTAAGLATGFALTTTGEVVSWGAVAGTKGILSGRPSSVTPSPLSNKIPSLGSITSLAVSGPTPGLVPPGALPNDPPPPPNQHACVVMKGDVYCWGRSERGAMGTATPEPVVASPLIARIESAAYAQQVAAGGKNTCARMTDGTVACTGQNDRGQLGTGTAGPFSATFVTAFSLTDHAVEVAVASESVCALLKDGTVACWGSNIHGELGFGTRDRDPHPTATKVPF